MISIFTFDLGNRLEHMQIVIDLRQLMIWSHFWQAPCCVPWADRESSSSFAGTYYPGPWWTARNSSQWAARNPSQSTINNTEDDQLNGTWSQRMNHFNCFWSKSISRRQVFTKFTVEVKWPRASPLGLGSPPLGSSPPRGALTSRYAHLAKHQLKSETTYG